MNETPRTDAVIIDQAWRSPDKWVTQIQTFEQLARTLERELAESQEQCRALTASNLEWIKATGPNGWIENLRSELANAKDVQQFMTAKCLEAQEIARLAQNEIIDLRSELAAEKIKREAAERRLREYKVGIEALVSAWA